jgi:hypothetical protein
MGGALTSYITLTIMKLINKGATDLIRHLIKLLVHQLQAKLN